MRIFTTGQCAKYCNVAPATVSKWIVSGMLKGYTIPGSTHRRVTEQSLIAFIKKHGMPMPEEFQQKNDPTRD